MFILWVSGLSSTGIDYCRVRGYERIAVKESPPYLEQPFPTHVILMVSTKTLPAGDWPIYFYGFTGR